MLKINDLHAYYDEIEALKGIDMEIGEGEIVALIGSNGAGKTTTLNSISGALTRTGCIMWNDEDIVAENPVKIAKKGIMHVPEGRHVFVGLTVEDNLITGTANWNNFFGTKSYTDTLKEVYSLFPRLEERKKQMAWSLSGGEQQMLAIGRALMGRPKILLLDEPSMGLAPVIVTELFSKIVEINKTQGIPILLVEQNANLALHVSDRAYIIEGGKILISGESKKLLGNPQVIEAYMGKFAKK